MSPTCGNADAAYPDTPPCSLAEGHAGNHKSSKEPVPGAMYHYMWPNVQPRVLTTSDTLVYSPSYGHCKLTQVSVHGIRALVDYGDGDTTELGWEWKDVPSKWTHANGDPIDVPASKQKVKEAILAIRPKQCPVIDANDARLIGMLRRIGRKCATNDDALVVQRAADLLEEKCTT